MSENPVQDAPVGDRLPWYRRPLVWSGAGAAVVVAAVAALVGLVGQHPADQDSGGVAAGPVPTITLSPSTGTKTTSTATAKPSSSTAAKKPTATKPTTGQASQPATNQGGGSNSDTGGNAPVAAGTGNAGGVAVGGGNTGGQGITAQQPAPVAQQPAPAPAPVAPAVPKPAPAPAKPAPGPVIAPPPAVEQPPAAPVRENPNQSLVSINSHRLASGKPAFISPNPSCRLITTVTGTALDSYQHQDVVLAVYGTTAAAFSKGTEYDTLSVYQC